MDGAPALNLDAARLAAGRPVTLVPEAVAAATLWPGDGAIADHAPGAPPLWWFSRVAYTPDGEWALVYAVQVCPGISARMAAEAEPGAYESALLAPLQRQAGNWIVQEPLYLDVGLPRPGTSNSGGAGPQ